MEVPRNLSTNESLKKHISVVKSRSEKQLNSTKHSRKSSDALNKQYCFRDRRPSKDIQPEMRFSLKNYIRQKKSPELKENHGPRTFVAAMQTFYNKINIGLSNEESSFGKQEKSDSQRNVTQNPKQKSVINHDSEHDESVQSNPHHESINYLSDLAKSVLNKYHFFPKRPSNFLRQGEGKICSNPAMKTKEVYHLILR